MFNDLFARRGLSLDRLRAFLETAEGGGIAKAVGRNPVRQSQYSRQISELETFFGVELMRRAGHTLRLTPAGERLAALAREQLSGLSDFAGSCAGEPALYAIGAGDSLLRWLLLPRIGAMCRAFPLCRFETRNMRSDDLVRDLRAMRIDLGIVRRSAVLRPLKSRPLGELEYALFVPRRLLVTGRQRTFEWALRHLPLATQSSDGEFTARLRDIATRSGIALRIHLECETFAHAMEALKSGVYAAVLPRIAKRDFAGDDFVEIRSPALDRSRRAIVLCWNPRLTRIRESAAALVGHLSELLPLDRDVPSPAGRSCG